MSTTVSYKGNTIATLDNETKTLTTSGTWLEDDIEITDESSGGGEVLITDTIDSNGGTIRTITAANTVTLDGTRHIAPSNVQQTITPSQGYDGFSSVVVEPENRPDLCSPKDVDFIDYDGRLIYSYTVNEFLALTSLPANPTNEGLVAQGWNWTLTDAQNFVGKYGALVVGQNYTTDDGKTRIYVTIPQPLIDANKYLRLHIYLLASSSITVDWGDNTVETISNTGTSGAGKTPTHTYTQSGNYVITISVTGTIHLGYYGSNNSIIDNDWKQRVTVNKIEIGNNVTKFARQPFAELYNLVSISIPTTLTEVDTSTDLYMFSRCYHLKGVVFPSGFVGREQKWFNNNELSSLKYISVPKSMTKIQMGTYMRNLRKFTMYHLDVPATATNSYIILSDVASLTHFVVMGDYQRMGTDMCRASYIKKLFVPETVNYIGATAFVYNSFLEEIHLLPETPPTLANTNAFNSISSNAVFYVPYSEDHSILEAYQTATNWSTYASKMQEEPQS